MLLADVRSLIRAVSSSAKSPQVTKLPSSKSTENPALENLNFEKMKLIEKEGKLLEKGILKESGYSF